MMKKEIQNNYNTIYLLFFIIELVNIAENMNLLEHDVEENKKSFILYVILFVLIPVNPHSIPVN